MASPYEDRPPANALATPVNILSEVSAWQRIAQQVVRIMANGGDPASEVCEVLSPDVLDGKSWQTALGYLSVTTMTLCQIASDRYKWFNPSPLYAFLAFASEWSDGIATGSAIQGEMLARAAMPECCRLMTAAEQEHRKGWKPEKPAKRRGRPNDPAIDPEKDRKLVEDWEASRRSCGLTKAEFCRERGRDLEELNGAITRQRRARLKASGSRKTK